MNVAVCFNRVPPRLFKGEAADRISEEGAEAEARAVKKALTELGHTVRLLPLGSDIVPCIEELRTSRSELVFNLCEGFWGNSRLELHVAALFDLLGIAYTGGSPICLGLTQDKVRTKDLLVRHGLPTAKYILVKMGEQFPKTRDLTYLLIVKPRFEDASLGITSDSIVESERFAADLPLGDKAVAWLVHGGGPIWRARLRQQVSGSSTAFDAYMDAAREASHIEGTAEALAGLYALDSNELTPTSVVPTQASCVIVRGEQDQLLTSEAAEELAFQLGAQVRTVEGAGHLVPLDDPTILRQLVESLLKK